MHIYVKHTKHIPYNVRLFCVEKDYLQNNFFLARNAPNFSFIIYCKKANKSPVTRYKYNMMVSMQDRSATDVIFTKVNELFVAYFYVYVNRPEVHKIARLLLL